MNKDDYQQFSALLEDCAEVLGRQKPTGRQIALFFGIVNAYPLHEIKKSIEAHLKDADRGRFFPVPADLIKHIESGVSGGITADEAWAIAIKSTDESATVVWTSDIAKAWSASAPIMRIGDEVGARMAFKGAFDRISKEYASTGVRSEWIVSEGFDKNCRAHAIQEAIELGRLPSVEWSNYLMINNSDCLMIANSESDNKKETSKGYEWFKKRSKEMLESWENKRNYPNSADLEREENKRRKEEASKAVNDYLNKEEKNGI